MPQTEPITIVDALRNNVERVPDKLVYTFLENGEDPVASLTNAQLDMRARSIASELLQDGAPEDRVLILCPQGIEYVEAFYGCLYAGMTPVPLYPPRLNRPLSAIQNIASDVQASRALTTRQIYHSLEGRLANEPELQALPWINAEEIPTEDAPWENPGVGAESLAFFQYTSGSTGAPKGVMVQQKNLLYNIKMFSSAFNLSEDTVTVSWMPLYHDFGLIMMMLSAVRLACHSVLLPPMSFFQRPLRWLHAITKYKGTYNGAPNFAFDLCVDQGKPEEFEGLDLSSWEVVVDAAEAVRSKSMQRFCETFEPYGFRPSTIRPSYGMAEATVWVCGYRESETAHVYRAAHQDLIQGRVRRAADDEDDVVEIVSCGRPYLDTKIAIADPETMEELGEERVGEVWVKGPHIAKGYWNKPKETAETFDAHLANGDGPYMRTGDLGFMYNGELFFTGRIKEVIIIQGENHYPHDVEATVQAGHDALQPNSGAAFAVDANDKEHLVIVQEVKRTARRNLDGAAVVRAVSLAVAKEHGLTPAAVILIRPLSLDKTSSGKIQRSTCKKKFLEQDLQIIHEWRSPVLDDGQNN